MNGIDYGTLEPLLFPHPFLLHHFLRSIRRGSLPRREVVVVTCRSVCMRRAMSCVLEMWALETSSSARSDGGRKEKRQDAEPISSQLVWYDVVDHLFNCGQGYHDIIPPVAPDLMAGPFMISST